MFEKAARTDYDDETVWGVDWSSFHHLPSLSFYMNIQSYVLTTDKTDEFFLLHKKATHPWTFIYRKRNTTTISQKREIIRDIINVGEA